MMLPSSDKDLWVDLRDRKITFSQFEGRIYSRTGVCEYLLLDDLWDELADSIKDRITNA
jgi:hypothetical protein